MRRGRKNEARDQWLEEEGYRFEEDIVELPVDGIDNEGDLLDVNLGSAVDEVAHEARQLHWKGCFL